MARIKNRGKHTINKLSAAKKSNTRFTFQYVRREACRIKAVRASSEILSNAVFATEITFSSLHFRRAQRAAYRKFPLAYEKVYLSHFIWQNPHFKCLLKTYTLPRGAVLSLKRTAPPFTLSPLAQQRFQPRGPNAREREPAVSAVPKHPRRLFFYVFAEANATSMTSGTPTASANAKRILGDWTAERQADKIECKVFPRLGTRGGCL